MVIRCTKTEISNSIYQTGISMSTITFFNKETLWNDAVRNVVRAIRIYAYMQREKERKKERKEKRYNSANTPSCDDIQIEKALGDFHRETLPHIHTDIDRAIGRGGGRERWR